MSKSEVSKSEVSNRPPNGVDKKAKTVKIILGLSLALNIFFAGLVLGRLYSGDHRVGQAVSPAADMNLRHMFRYLSPEEKAAARKIFNWDSFKSQRQALRHSHKQRWKIEKKIRLLVAAESVDIKALAAALESHEKLSRKMVEPVKHFMLEFIPTLPQETRRRIARAMFAKKHKTKAGRHGHYQRSPDRPDHSGHSDQPFQPDQPDQPDQSDQPGQSGPQEAESKQKPEGMSKESR